MHTCDKPCGNKTASGYCATTACINPQYSNIGTAQYGQGVQKRVLAHYDRVISKTPEELAEFLTTEDMCELICAPVPPHCDGQCKQKMLDWLKQEVPTNG